MAQTDQVNGEILFEALVAEPECEWIEYKHNNSEPDEIGEYISAVSNSAALWGKEAGFIIWGVEDGSRKVVGTSFNPQKQKVKGQELENWLVTQLKPMGDFRILEFEFRKMPIVILEVQPARQFPIRFKETEFIRVGSYKKKLRDHPEKERALWARFSQTSFEKSIAKSNVETGDVLELLDYPTYFKRVNLPLPDNKAGILERLASEKLIVRRPNGEFDITNFGAILFARDLGQFDRLGRKGLRVIMYKGKNRVETIKELTGKRGYAAGFSGLSLTSMTNFRETSKLDKP